jgi:hypothetical protein
LCWIWNGAIFTSSNGPPFFATRLESEYIICFKGIVWHAY